MVPPDTVVSDAAANAAGAMAPAISEATTIARNLFFINNKPVQKLI
jgi:hypothetical protein